MEALFCCFRNQRPIFPAATGIGASIIPFAFLIWGLCDLGFNRKGVEAIYIIAFVLVVMTLVGFVTVLILLYIAPNPSSYRTVNNLGRVLCLVIIFMCIIALIFLFVSFIILLVDYSKLRKYLKHLRDNPDYEENYDPSWGYYEVFDPDVNKISSKEWAAVIVPLIFSFICLPVMALAANYLYKVFSNKMNTPPNLPVNITQNTIPTLPNIPQPGMFPNNNGPVPPMGNNIAYPVGIQQSGININQK